ncbi:MAG: hypothetical protein ABH828_03250 [archaeon]
MTIVGFNFTRLLVEKNKSIKGKVNISNNVTIKAVSESTLAIDKKKKALKFEFLFTSKYEPGLGTIDIGGEVIYLADEKVAKGALDGWKKEKKVSKEILQGLMTHILSKCNVEAVVLSREVNLPPPIPMPKVK